MNVEATQPVNQCSNHSNNSKRNRRNTDPSCHHEPVPKELPHNTLRMQLVFHTPLLALNRASKKKTLLVVWHALQKSELVSRQQLFCYVKYWLLKLCSPRLWSPRLIEMITGIKIQAINSFHLFTVSMTAIFWKGLRVWQCVTWVILKKDTTTWQQLSENHVISKSNNQFTVNKLDNPKERK